MKGTAALSSKNDGEFNISDQRNSNLVHFHQLPLSPALDGPISMECPLLSTASSLIWKKIQPLKAFAGQAQKQCIYAVEGARPISY